MSDHVNAVRLRLSTRLRAARKALGLTQGEVADLVLWSYAKYSRVEGGSRGTSGSDLLLLMPRLQIPEEEHPLLLAMARQSQQKSAYARYSNILGAGAIECFDATAVAHEVHEFSSHLIPLMLRTEAYQAALTRVQLTRHPNRLDPVVQAGPERSGEVSPPIPDLRHGRVRIITPHRWPGGDV